MDDKGNEFHFNENISGIYEASIPQNNLSLNSRFQLHFTTPDKNEYESDFEPILKSSPIDSVYFNFESFQSSSEYYDDGLQFYVDLKADEQNSKNYRWTIEETWEIRSDYYITGRWDDNLQEGRHWENYDSLFYCWSTAKIKGFYSASTENLIINEKKKIPLKYVPGTSTKITYKYSLLVKQFALSEQAYEYWNRNKVESSECGGLYQTQPSQSKSNIHNINDPNEIVLGFFWASSYREKRIFVELSGADKKYNYYHPCNEEILAPEDFVLLMDGAYLYQVSPISFLTVWDEAYNNIEVCFDCRTQGGVLTKPDYWD